MTASRLRLTSLLFALVTFACGGPRKPAPRVEMYLAKAQQLEGHSMLPEAIAEAEKAVTTDPDWPTSQALLGHLLRVAGLESGAGRDDRLGYYRRARAALERAIALDSGAADPRIDLAQLLADSNQGREAALILEPVASSGHPEARFHLASIVMGLGDLDRAKQLFRAGIETRPDDARARIAYGLALERSGSLEGGREQYEAAVRLKPDSAEAFFRLGSVLAKLGDGARAIVALARATDLNPDSEDALYALAMAQRRAGHDDVANRTQQTFDALRSGRERVAQLEEALARAADNLDIRSELAETYLERGRLLRALSAAKTVLDGRPVDARSRRVVAEAHRRLGSRELALSQADLAVEYGRRDARAFELRGVIRFEDGNLPGAQEDLLAAYERGHRSGRLIEHLARLAMAAGRPDESLRFAQQGIAAGMADRRVFLVASEALILLGRKSEAAPVLATLLRWYPADVEALGLLAGLSAEFGDIEREREYRQRLEFVLPAPVTAS